MARRAPTLEAFLAATRRPVEVIGGARATEAQGPLRVLGVDPGSRNTGWGIVEATGARRVHIASGTIRCGEGPLPQRLRRVLDELERLIAIHGPSEAAIEEVFVRRNVSSSLVLGQARGAALCALAGAGLTIAEYAPSQVKLATVGSGRAEKAQVQFMVTRLLSLPETPAADEADALAIALCHTQLRPRVAG